MRSRFLTENRWLLKLCAGVARFCGLLLLFATGVLVAVTVVLMISGHVDLHTTGARLDQSLTMILMILFYGFLSLILSEFISYLLAEQGEPKWILRHGDKIIYAYVLYATVMSAIGAARLCASGPEIGTVAPLRDWYLSLALAVVFIVLRMLIWIGIAIALHKVVPIIRESKTLV